MIVWLTEAEEFVGKVLHICGCFLCSSLEAARIEVTSIRMQNTPFSAVPPMQRSGLQGVTDDSLSHNFQHY